MVISAALICLANVLFNEARGESVRTQQIVAATLLNRVNSEGNTSICKEASKPEQYAARQHPKHILLNRRINGGVAHTAGEVLLHKEKYIKMYNGYKYFNAASLGVRFNTGMPPLLSGGMWFY